jgi:DNA polymerase III alpha subunit
MIQSKFGELIFSESDVCNLLMQGHGVDLLNDMIVDDSVSLEKMPPELMESVPGIIKQKFHNISVPEFHAQQQKNWHMPDSYKTLDIADHVLKLCNNEAELQRCGEELLIYQERELFDLLRYLKYLVDVMKQNNIVWGVGRGSSVASFVLYKLEVHRINSLYYNLDVTEFLR